MGARTTLNGVYLSGTLALAAILGLIAGSWAVFVISLVVLIAANVHSGRIRPRRPHRSRRTRHPD